MKDAVDMFMREIGSRGKLKILTSLLDGPLSVKEIVEKTGLEQTHVSHNLSSLFMCKFVDKAVLGNKHEYSLNKEIKPLIKGIVSYVKKYESFLVKCGFFMK